MKIEQAVATYVGYQQSLGMRFTTQARMLKSFSKTVGNVDVERIGAKTVRAFLDGTGPMTRYWHCKFGTLTGFYRFCLARGYVSTVPLPNREPRCSETFTPYIYSDDEIKRLLHAAAGRGSCRIDALTSRTLLLLLYATGLRISEALNLNLADVDLDARVLHVRGSKFYKTRLVPMGADLTQVMGEYARRRLQRPPLDSDAPFLLTSLGKRILRAAAEQAFHHIRSQAKVSRDDGGRYQPRLHDLRHTAAVTRLVRWYREGIDVQRLLPQLATYLGHVHISGTQCYLNMTPELLQLASARFEEFFLRETRHG